MTRTPSLLLICFVMACCLAAAPSHAATTQCSWSFISGSGANYLNYCVTMNGNIALLQIGSYQWINAQSSGSGGEGYGVCDQNAPMNYTDYAVSDTGNWNAPVVLSHNGTSVKIARTTSDGNWTLTQTISKMAKTSSITVVMALKNNQSIDDVAYLVRFADPFHAAGPNGDWWFATGNGAQLWYSQAGSGGGSIPPAGAGLQLQNTGAAPFSFQQGFVQTGSASTTGPNACAFAYNASQYNLYSSSSNASSLVMAYVGAVPAGQTRTVTLTYRGL